MVAGDVPQGAIDNSPAFGEMAGQGLHARGARQEAQRPEMLGETRQLGEDDSQRLRALRRDDTE